MPVSTYATPDVIPDMTTLPEAPVSPAPIATEHAEMWALIQRSQAGDADAFGQIWERYKADVLRYIYARVTHPQLTQDLASEVWLRAFRRIGTYAYEGKDFGAFLITVARNIVADHFGRWSTRTEIFADEFYSWERPETDRRVLPEAATEEYFTDRTLAAAIMQLAADQREVIILRFFRGLSVNETAEVMGKNVGAVKALQYRAVRAIAYLLPDGFDPQGRMPQTAPRGYTGERLAQRRVR